MKRNIETGIRLKAVLIYLVVAVICCGMIIYIYNLRQGIEDQRQRVEQYHRTLAVTNEFVYAVNQAQAEANLYVTSKNVSHWRAYRRKTEEVKLLADSLKVNAGQDSILVEINALLDKKGGIVSELNKLFGDHNPLDSISERIEGFGHTRMKDSLKVTTTVKDTVVQKIPKKGFWKRVGEVFSPGSQPDSIVSVVSRKTDMVKLPEKMSQDRPSVKVVIAEDASKIFSSQISAIEEQVNHLIVIDQEISTQIFNMLHQLSSQTINSTLAGIRESARLISRNYAFSIIGGGLSLILIMIFVILIINDVNKGKAARKALEKANERTRQIMESRHQLLLSVSHDIKTPLSSILGYLELGRGKASIPQGPLRTMQNSGKHIMALLENLLEFSSLEQGNLAVACCNFNLWQLCTETSEMFEPLAHQKKLAFDDRFDMDEGTDVYSDALKIKQVIINLLSNAVKYTQAGNIIFRATYDAGHVNFRISDTGAGIPASQMDTLFKPFVRMDANSALAPGSGLGMYVVKGLVELLHGTIDVTSVVGEGTQIKVMIPAALADEKRIVAKTSKKILLVDDDPALLTMLKDMLLKMGHKVDICDHPSLFDASLGKYDMVITDMEMGNVSGTDILSKIRNSGTNVAVVIMTGRGDYSEAKAKEAGFDGYLSKPVTMHVLEGLTGTAVSGSMVSEAAAPATGEFSLLEEMFDGDRQAIAEVLNVFVNATSDNIRILRQAVTDDDFGQAQALCHKMLPMFMQIGAPTDCVDFLTQMDAARNDNPDQHPYWRGIVSDFTAFAEKLMEKIRKEYL